MAALVTRGLSEMSRLGAAMGANPLTFAGLSGLGDLVVTCASKHSRNRRLGLLLAKGATLDDALEEIIARYDEVQNATSIAGYSIVSGTLQPNAGMSFIQLKDWESRPDEQNHANAVVRRLNADFAREITGGIGFAFGPPAIPGLGTGSGFTMMLQDRGGNSPAYLAEQTGKFIQAATARPG